MASEPQGCLCSRWEGSGDLSVVDWVPVAVSCPYFSTGSEGQVLPTLVTQAPFP